LWVIGKNIHINTPMILFSLCCKTNNEKTNHSQSKLCLDFILFLRTDLWFQIPKLFKKSCLKVSRKIFPFKEKITCFQYNYNTRSLFCRFLPPGSHSWVICRMVWMTHNKCFFTNAKILTQSLVDLRRKQFYFFYIGAVPSPPYFQRIGKNFTFFFFFHRTRKLRLNYLPPSICQNPWKWWWFRRNSPDRIQKKQ